MVLAFLAPAGCFVGPQEDIPLDPESDQGRGNDDAGAGAAVDGDADEDDDLENPDSPPAEGGADDDGDIDVDEGNDGEHLDPTVEDVEGATVPVVGIPRPGLQSPRPDGPDFDTAAVLDPGPATFGDVERSTDEEP